MPDLFLRWTVRIAFACYIAALAARITCGRMQRRHTLARLLWTVGCVIFLAHVWAAFQFVHHWSHADAFRETARQTQLMTGSNSGAGLWLNYLFAAMWMADSIGWWLAGTSRYAARSRWIDVPMQAFFAFMWLNATIVFGHGFARWMGIVGELTLIGFAVHRRRRRRGGTGVR